MTRPQAPVFIDLEASGLGQSSYPIEVGVALPEPLPGEGWNVVLWSALIRPAAVWLARDDVWDPEAERLHGITREMLAKEGQPPVEVARQLDALVGNRAVVTDTGAAGRDASWLAELARVAGLSAWPSSWALATEGAGTLIRRQAQLAGTGASLLAMEAAEPPATHAAAEDSFRHAWRWCIVAGKARGRVSISPTSRYRRRLA